MKVSVLFSGGKDSSLSALLMEPFFEVELVTCNFGLLPTGEIAAKLLRSYIFHTGYFLLSEKSWKRHARWY